MSRQTKQRAALQHLRSLANQPYEQAGHALEILERERSTQVVSEALEALAHAPVREGRPLLLRLYTYYDKAGVKRDAGEDLPPQREECAGDLRAAGLVLLSQLDPMLASFRCARLLVDVHTSRMSGEPAISAIRILARQGSPFPLQRHLLPLYSYLFAQDERLPEVEAECLRHLAGASASAVSSVLSYYTAPISIGTGIALPRYETRDDAALLGLLDLVLASPTTTRVSLFTSSFCVKRSATTSISRCLPRSPRLIPRSSGRCRL